MLMLTLGALCGAVAFTALVGIGLGRDMPLEAALATAGFLTLAPPIGVALAQTRGDRLTLLGATMFVWSAGLAATLPAYIEADLAVAVADGADMIQTGGSPLPMAHPVDSQALPTAAIASLAAEAEVADNGVISLPYEGEGRRLSVPVVFGHEGRELDVEMMLDTGATYTTLPMDQLALLGIFPDNTAPSLTLHTANGVREAQVVLLDSVWLGDLQIKGVAIATCDECASSGSAGLLGLNVVGGFNVTIDADVREVLFSSRRHHDRKLDIKPFSDLNASFSRFPGGRVEVEVVLENRADRAIDAAEALVSCESGEWAVDLGSTSALGHTTVNRRLPRHPRCSSYLIGFHTASW